MQNISKGGRSVSLRSENRKRILHATLGKNILESNERLGYFNPRTQRYMSKTDLRKIDLMSRRPSNKGKSIKQLRETVKRNNVIRKGGIWYDGLNSEQVLDKELLATLTQKTVF